jgi:hypothetical protein
MSMSHRFNKLALIGSTKPLLASILKIKVWTLSQPISKVVTCFYPSHLHIPKKKRPFVSTILESLWNSR